MPPINRSGARSDSTAATRFLRPNRIFAEPSVLKTVRENEIAVPRAPPLDDDA